MNPIPGFSVGHAADRVLRSGVTVFLAEAPAVAAVHVSGGAPATRETNLLRPGNTVERVDAIVLSGGSAFGLAAADGVMGWLSERGRGFEVGPFRVPIVPAASLFDLNNHGDELPITGGSAAGIYRALGVAACEAAAGNLAAGGDLAAVGSVGAGTGATTADLKGGFGAADTSFQDGGRLAAFVAVNAVGRATIGGSPYFRAAPFEQDGEFGGLGLPVRLPPDAAAVVMKGPAAPLAGTTLAVLATDYDLTRSEAKRLAVAAHDGIALAIFPAHTPLDGDAVFTMATGARRLEDRPRNLLHLSAAAASTLARACARAVFAAEAAPGDRLPTWRMRYGGQDALQAS